eukprot:6140614-Alexandrium_andersonii.AAC.1
MCIRDRATPAGSGSAGPGPKASTLGPGAAFSGRGRGAGGLRPLRDARGRARTGAGRAGRAFDVSLALATLLRHDNDREVRHRTDTAGW